MPDVAGCMPKASARGCEAAIAAEGLCVNSEVGCQSVNEADEAVTLSTASSSTSPGSIKRPISPSRAVSLSSNKMAPLSIPEKNEDFPLDEQGNEEVRYCIEAALAPRHVGKDIDVKEQLLRDKIQRQVELHQKKKLELLEKQANYDLLQETTLRLTRQVRVLDSGNDGLRDKLEQLQDEIGKATSRRTLRGRDNKVCNATQGVGSSHSNALDTSNLTKTLESYRRKLRTAEAEHEKLLDDLQLAVARRRGRAAAHALLPSSSIPSNIPYAPLNPIEGYSEPNSKSCLPRDSSEADTLRQLEAMIADVLVISRQQSSSASLNKERDVENKVSYSLE